MKQVELVNGDLRFPALLTGDGAPVLLLHGFPDTHENWADIMQRLARAGYTAVAPALRGYAPSCQPGSGDYALTAALEDLMAFTDQLGGRLHLIGARCWATWPARAIRKPSALFPRWRYRL